jgi:hypothetical protein
VPRRNRRLYFCLPEISGIGISLKTDEPAF